MNRRVSGWLGVVAVVSLLAPGCKSDPLSDLDGSPTAIVTSFTDLTVSVGTSVTFTAQVVDGRSTPLETAITFSACDTKVTAGADATYDPVPRTSARAIVTGVSAGTSCVNVQGGGLTATVNVTVS
ncbi:MAG: hypothetical protein HYS40_03670 [Gemmatimonadetes bacterium]|nr:hypothetical protein [Gemmatimonadota bacterium]